MSYHCRLKALSNYSGPLITAFHDLLSNVCVFVCAHISVCQCMRGQSLLGCQLMLNLKDNLDIDL